MLVAAYAPTLSTRFGIAGAHVNIAERTRTDVSLWDVTSANLTAGDALPTGGAAILQVSAVRRTDVFSTQ